MDSCDMFGDLDFDDQFVNDMFNMDQHINFDDQGFSFDDQSTSTTLSPITPTPSPCTSEAPTTPKDQPIVKSSTMVYAPRKGGKRIRLDSSSDSSSGFGSSSELSDTDSSSDGSGIGDEGEIYSPMRRKVSKLTNKGRKPISPLKIKNGIEYEDGGILHYNFTTAQVASARISHGNYICNFFAKYANAKITNGVCNIILPTVSGITLPKIQLKSPTMKDIITGIQELFQHEVPKSSLKKLKNKKRSVHMRVLHLYDNATYYAGLKRVDVDTWKLQLKKETEPFQLVTYTS